MWNLFWEYPLTAGFTFFLVLFYFLVILFIPTSIINHYFLSYPGEFFPDNWTLSIFFHSSPGHLFSNVAFLFFLGRVVEEKVGKVKWLLFYFMAGFISVIADSVIRGYIYPDPHPVVGASGAISGLAAVSALLSPLSIRVGGYRVFFPVFAVAWIMIYSDFIGLFEDDKIAHWSHLAGFFSVFVTAYLLNPEEREKLQKGFLINLAFFTLTLILFYLVSNR
ncbi:MAG: rhomboid family intramembrane serine protease [Leptospiraceae bacterium]|nr:rhomboid family intramembrane serine protease [Leptospiraceae bacterium]MCP5498557.1 rhomboid family intramembrane serine protease [Leptospiraceae bacterium]